MGTSGCIGILLAGGLARRMGGGDKALRHLGGLPLLAHAIAALRPQCAGLIISANGDPARFSGFGLPVIADTVPGYKGPLAGILAGLDWIAAHYPDAQFAISAPADTPFLPANLVARLIGARNEHTSQLACASSRGRIHPAVAMWPAAIRDGLRRALIIDDTRKIDALAQLYNRAIADWPADPYDPFFNVNELSDIAMAEEILQWRENEIA
ncbi:MAG: molybdenum cofactor guanylyltransferase MobA [Beijerinckiaceae bacterium]|nr:molybdenum cofactor guanylyltransferase MobA [Beijerinckiaceae bacterium]MCI0736960.1 molybdenum cofactor guanylyltransferase MobA [Beijerinckiaceae bacterium]